MTTIADIRAGKTCPGCSADCRNFVNEADCCIYQTTISALFSEVIEDDSDEEVHYEPVKKGRILVGMKNTDELPIKVLKMLKWTA